MDNVHWQSRWDVEKDTFGADFQGHSNTSWMCDEGDVEVFGLNNSGWHKRLCVVPNKNMAIVREDLRQ